jgi:hypothetical protein
LSSCEKKSFEINLFNPACGYIKHSYYFKNGGRKSGTNVEQTKKLAEKPVLAKVCFSYWELIVALIFLIVFGGQETDSKWRTRIGRPSDPQNNHLNLKFTFEPIFNSPIVPVWLVVLLSWSSKLRPLGKTFSPSLNTK